MKSRLNSPVWGSLRSPDQGLQSTVLLMCQFKSNEYTQTTLLRRDVLALEVLHMNNPIKFTKSRHSGMQYMASTNVCRLDSRCSVNLFTAIGLISNFTSCI